MHGLLMLMLIEIASVLCHRMTLKVAMWVASVTRTVCMTSQLYNYDSVVS